MAKRRERSDFEIYLQGHCRLIGDGMRGVQFIRRGRKWAYFRETATCFPCKVTLAVWDRLVNRAYSRRAA